MLLATIGIMRRYIGGPALVVFAAAVASATNAFVGGPEAVYFVAAVVAAAGAVWMAIQGAQSERELRAAVTGGDSWCYLVLGGLSGGGNSALFTAVHQGDCPLYDVSARIVDLDKFDLIKDNLSLEALAQAQTNLNLGNLSPKQATLLVTLEIPEKGVRWNIFFSARNGSFDEKLRLVRVEGRWVSAMRVMRRDGGKQVVLVEQVDPQFPRDSKGAVEW